MAKEKGRISYNDVLRFPPAIQQQIWNKLAQQGVIVNTSPVEQGSPQGRRKASMASLPLMIICSILILSMMWLAGLTGGGEHGGSSTSFRTSIIR